MRWVQARRKYDVEEAEYGLDMDKVLDNLVRLPAPLSARNSVKAPSEGNHEGTGDEVVVTNGLADGQSDESDDELEFDFQPKTV